MNLDILMLIAFGIFIVLLIWRMQGDNDSEKQKGKTDEKVLGWAKIRKWWMVVQSVVLCGLLFYMVPLLWDDFQFFQERDVIRVTLRCFVFMLAIYILFVRIRRFLKEYRGNIE